MARNGIFLLSVFLKLLAETKKSMEGFFCSINPEFLINCSVMDYSNPLIVQSDRTLLLDVHAPLATECRNALIPFAELERSPEHLHTYRLTPLSLWNASGAGFSPEDAVEVLHKFARYDVP